jgi:drug/metabolite transporter (DMT)-like permease
MSGTPSSRGELAATAGLLLTAFCWGSMVPLTSVLLAHLPPFLIAAARYTLGVPVLALLIALIEEGPILPRGLPWLRILKLGGFGIAAFATCYTFGIWYSGPVTAAAILATGPVVAVLMDRAMGGRRIAGRTGIAVAVAVVGGLIAAFGRPHAGSAHHGGEILIVVALVCWTWYSVQAQAWLGHLGIGSLRLTMVTTGAASLSLWLIYGVTALAGIQPLPAAAPTADDLAILGWLVVGPTAVAICTWNLGISRLGVTVATLFLNLSPIFAVLIGLPFGADPTAAELAGGGLAIAAVVWLQLGQLGRRAKAARPMDAPQQTG